MRFFLKVLFSVVLFTGLSSVVEQLLPQAAENRRKPVGSPKVAWWSASGVHTQSTHNFKGLLESSKTPFKGLRRESGLAEVRCEVGMVGCGCVLNDLLVNSP